MSHLKICDLRMNLFLESLEKSVTPSSIESRRFLNEISSGQHGFFSVSHPHAFHNRFAARPSQAQRDAPT
ncbi:hypothetical protein [Burkholderia cenocepacia]|uniref:Uncharacterized protein n=1 Tax=Burkholderia cenocepacia TaxID=95486 RepID=A0A3Q9FE02_9BURK|nr:hypothetical protein [Burkholderia cenocepacia]AZQ56125.1 hypothetical protein D5R55_35660 [Burkholderia cenocepacia]